MFFLSWSNVGLLFPWSLQEIKILVSYTNYWHIS
jgi:hypothetical protein